ncbi:18184_t:CDS:2 [Funneliformis geosporum]|uniref:8416_t:CDS:1 n=1 Tax=Funneliformis geosporum TaxID=1117311 RepID=A0A9W4SMP9_9GLOM|nr:18184_t:CDS:2 [Funneliformis geosporum]CAI2175053.1 8416_t:CDS:2 [Funneliformis geosporum]
MKLLCIGGLILLGMTLILWLFVPADPSLSETKQVSSEITDKSEEIPKLHQNLPSIHSHSNSNSESKVNSQDSNIIPSTFPETHSEPPNEMIPSLVTKQPLHTPSNTKLKELRPTTTNSVKVKNYKTFNLTLRNETRSPDGFSRYVFTINNKFPGPEIIVNKGDNIRLNVTNYIGHPTTIHVHGMIHNKTVYMDGVPYITQCPIQNGSSFIYEFKATNPGTYLYYSHYETQRADGLYGALIVKDPEESKLYNYDDEKTILLSDWYHEESAALLKKYKYNNASISDFFEPVPNSGLINGRGIFNCENYENDPINKERCNFKILEIVGFHFEPHKKTRLRIINTSALTSFYFSIDGHMLQVIEVDGTPTEISSEFHRLPIHVGQRYSIIPTRLSQFNSTSNFYLRVEITKKSFRSTTPYDMLPTEFNAIIRYEDQDDSSLPSTSSWTLQQSSSIFSIIDLKPFDLRPQFHEKLQRNTTFFQFDLIIDKIDEHKSLKFKNKGFNDNDIDNVEQFYGSINSVQRGASLYNPNKTTNTHGHKFWVLGQGAESTPKYSNLNDIDPIKRDTVVVPALGWTLIKFNIENPGISTFNNPIVWHKNIGMLGQIIEFPKNIKKSTIPPIEWCKLCRDEINLKESNNTTGIRDVKSPMGQGPKQSMKSGPVRNSLNYGTVVLFKMGLAVPGLQS